MLYKTDTNGSECWPFSKKDGNTPRILERKMLRMVYVPINHNGIWITRYNNELYTLYNETDIVELIKMGRMGWLGHLCRIRELGPCRKLTRLKPEGTLRVAKPEFRWLESVEENLKKVGVRN
jgi:hypothetical protein